MNHHKLVYIIKLFEILFKKIIFYVNDYWNYAKSYMNLKSQI